MVLNNVANFVEDMAICVQVVYPNCMLSTCLPAHMKATIRYLCFKYSSYVYSSKFCRLILFAVVWFMSRNFETLLGAIVIAIVHDLVRIFSCIKVYIIEFCSPHDNVDLTIGHFWWNRLHVFC